MSTPIKLEDIQDGDRIREIHEYTRALPLNETVTYELLSRPVPLPTEQGSVIAGGGHVAVIGDDGNWRADDTIGSVTPERLREYFPEFTVLRPVPEVAAEVFRSLRAEFSWLFDDDAVGSRKERFEAIAAGWANA